ncbi:hypothetical protein CAPTEDRAFT_223647 [Capitella teleta]|uniref:Uncharacterized protein n=1 Tax=Capitella teleta TaxID=283909 RepID=R7UX29_CAPTE|nr:hypothetical protein CAPTEDRAFT_223647 [Capitella teleta]|eukprot:ELU10832.1 hypothetical protein CAPTEDRAFT_223647 [Capitella teleta]
MSNLCVYIIIQANIHSYVLRYGSSKTMTKRLVRIEVQPGQFLQAPIVSLVGYSPTMNAVTALYSAENNYLAEHPDDIESPFGITLAKSEFKRCIVLASVGGVKADATGHWNIKISDDNNKVKSSGACVEHVPIFPGYTVSLNFTDDNSDAGVGLAPYR